MIRMPLATASLLAIAISLAGCGEGKDKAAAPQAPTPAASTAAPVAPAAAGKIDEAAAKAVVAHYADIVYAVYSDAESTAKTLQTAIDAFLAKPNAETLKAAKAAWVAARVPYLQSEVFRFGNTIIDDWEGQVNAWPLDEGLIDYVDFVFANLDFGIGDDVGAGTRVAQGVLVALVDVVDQAFVQGPGVNLTFPVVDDGVAEAEHFALQVRNAGSDPGSLGRFQGVGVRLGEEGVDGGLQGFRGRFGIAVDGEDDVGVMRDNGFGGGFVDFAGSGGCNSRGRGAGGRRSDSFVFTFATTGEGNSDGQQTGGSQRHTNHGEHPASRGG